MRIIAPAIEIDDLLKGFSCFSVHGRPFTGTGLSYISSRTETMRGIDNARWTPLKEKCNIFEWVIIEYFVKSLPIPCRCATFIDT